MIVQLCTNNNYTSYDRAAMYKQYLHLLRSCSSEQTIITTVMIVQLCTNNNYTSYGRAALYKP